MPADPRRFSKANLLRWLECYPVCRPLGPRLEHEEDLGHMDRGGNAATQALKVEVRAWKGQLSRRAWKEALGKQLNKVHEAVKPWGFTSRDGWSQCVGSPPERWYWYGYYRQVIALQEGSEDYFE